MGGGPAVHVVGLAAGGVEAVEFAAVPARHALLAVGRHGGGGDVGLPQDGVGAVGETVQGLEAGHRVGDVGQVVGRVVAGAVVLVVGAAALGGGALHLERRRRGLGSSIFSALGTE